MSQKTIISTALKRIIIAFPLLFIGPVIIHSAFKNQLHPFYIPVLIIGCIVCLSAVLLLFFGIKRLVGDLFDNDQKI